MYERQQDRWSRVPTEQDRTTNDMRTTGTDRDMSDKAGEMKDRAAEKAGEMKDRAGEIMDRAQEEVDSRRGQAAGGIQDAAGMIRDKTQDQSGITAKVGGQVAEGMEGTANYIQTHTTSDMVKDIENFAREHPGQAIVGAVLAGLLIGKILR
jgi:ElaB/YqjD/DUF883 family membrane-anchored ribosome-binding protein